MNNFSTITLVTWETRNWRHNDKALLWCKNYGLKPITRTVYIGKLYIKERALLQKKFQLVFNKKTEKFALMGLCQSCFDVAKIDDTIKRNAEHISNFELIQFPEISPKLGNKHRLLQ